MCNAKRVEVCQQSRMEKKPYKRYARKKIPFKDKLWANKYPKLAKIMDGNNPGNPVDYQRDFDPRCDLNDYAWDTGCPHPTLPKEAKPRYHVGPAAIPEEPLPLGYKTGKEPAPNPCEGKRTIDAFNDNNWYKTLEKLLDEGIPKDLIDFRLNENLLPKVPEWCRKDNRDVSLVRKLEVLDLSDNNIGDIRIKAFQCLPNLKKLILNRIPMKRIRSNIFASLPVLYSLQISKIGFPLQKIDDYAFNSSSLSHLYMDVANFHFDREELNPKTIFSLSPNLSFLNLDHNFLPKNETKMQQIFSPLVRLKNLIISSTSLFILPKNVFPYLKSLETLTLSSNRLSDWNDGSDIFRNMTSLRNLNLKDNFIKIINKKTFPADVLKSLKVLDLSYNSFVCTCDQLWFTEWIKTTKVKLFSYPTLYNCRAPPSLDGTLFQKYVNSSKDCPPWNPIYTTVILLLLSATVLAVIFAIIMKCQTNIKNYLYLWRINYNRRKGYLPLQDADDFEYHAFVVYCDADRQWVHQKFLKKLEQDEGMKLCIHHRDFEIGESITANINNYLEKSWKVVVILSNDFADREEMYFY
ncbi:unnamed protein product [Mytilus edulis]|uniref:TIR domain-containing protein n=1 Tax=Mytilus edulis TaxID=6550 RepID=A0A8S3V8L3_MYTED|nr:unnamed protein product [Mytilus edulis]